MPRFTPKKPARPLRDKTSPSHRAKSKPRRIALRKSAAAASEDLASAFAGIIAAAMDAIIVVDERQTVVLFNAAAEQMFRCPAAQALGRPLGQFIPARFRPAHAAHVKAFGNAGHSRRGMGHLGTLAGLRADGQEFPMEATISQADVDGKKFFTAFIRETTERLLHEDSLSQLAAVVQSSEDAIISKTLEGIITSWNHAAERLFGYLAGEAIGQHISLIIPPNRLKEEQAIITRLRQGEHIQHYETERRRKDGSLLSVSLSISPLMDAAGRIIGASKIARDVTARKRDTEALLLFRALVDQSDDVLEVVDPVTARFLDVNQKGHDDLGYTREQFLQLRVFDIDPSVREADWAPLMAQLRRQGSMIIERAHQRKDGSVFPIEINMKLVRIDREYVIVVVRDITERKRQEEALQQVSERLREIAENINEVFWVTDPQMAHIYYVSPAYEKVWGRSCASLYADSHSWIAAIHPDDRSRVTTAATSAMASTGKYDEIYRISQVDGTPRWIHDRGFPVRDAAGRVVRIVGVAEDITQERRLEEQFRQAQKMEAIGTLAGGIAHDFNNILAAINGYAELARMKVGESSPVYDYLGSIAQAGTRAAALVRQILTFSRQQEQQRRPLDLAELVDEPLKLLRSTIPATIEFVIVKEPGLPLILADPTQIHQIFMNLGTNAWHAMRDKPGRLEVRIERFDVDAHFTEIHPRLRPGPYVRASVADLGSGMDDATLARIFEPFFTTKPKGEGTGLGLSVVHGIMESHDGLITVYSKPGEGTIFHLYFPAHAGSAAQPAAHHGPTPTGQGAAILYVDDEEALAQLGQKTLEQLGYVVTATTDVHLALEWVRREPARFDLVITDQTMPGLTGVQFAGELLKIRPDLPIILTTGYSPYLTAEHVRSLGIRELLLKPQTIHTLGVAVHHALAPKKA